MFYFDEGLDVEYRVPYTHAMSDQSRKAKQKPTIEMYNRETGEYLGRMSREQWEKGVKYEDL